MAHRSKENTMRKIVAGLFISLDGVIEAPHEWHFPYFNDDMGEAVSAQMQKSDTMLLGRVTYEEFAGYWPNQSEEAVEMAGYMNNTPKLVVSNSLKPADITWQNTRLITGNVVEQLTAIKAQPGKDISITGSATLVRSLLRDDLLDELQLLVHPVVVGRGKRLFVDDGMKKPLKLVNEKTFDNGVLHLTYQPDRS
jgi:dihydrofolate reductase